MAKRRVGKYPKKFRRMAVERLKTCDNIVGIVTGTWCASTASLQVARSIRSFRLLARNRLRGTRCESRSLRKEINQLKRVVA